MWYKRECDQMFVVGSDDDEEQHRDFVSVSSRRASVYSLEVSDLR